MLKKLCMMDLVHTGSNILTWAVCTGVVNLESLPNTVIPSIGRFWVVAFPSKDPETTSSTRLITGQYLHPVGPTTMN